MTQNIYDNDAFFEGYSQLDRSVLGLNGAPEWTSLRALMPDLNGARVADLGCGFGWFCRWAREQGAAAVLGFDVSENMLRRARDTTDDPAIVYAQADLEELTLPEASFDLIYSSLTLHYIANLPALLGRVHSALVPGGRLVMSVEHPIYTAPTNPGWVLDEHGHQTWPVNAYAVEGPRVTNWLAPDVIKHHRTIGGYLNLLMSMGFTLNHVEDWGPTEAQILAQPALVQERERPMLLLISARR